MIQLCMGVSSTVSLFRMWKLRFDIYSSTYTIAFLHTVGHRIRRSVTRLTEVERVYRRCLKTILA